MKTIVYSTKPHDQQFLSAANNDGRHTFTFVEARLAPETAALADGHNAVCAFVNDQLDRPILERLSNVGVKMVALRCAGFNNVDLRAAKELGLCVARVPAYSPYAVAEHTIGLMLALNRNIHRAYNRVREGNFALHGLLGFDLHGKTVGVIGTGKIGRIVAQTLHAGFGCNVLAFDLEEDAELIALGIRYAPLADVLTAGQIVTLHCPLTPETHHLINAATLQTMQQGVMLINTSRGGLVDTSAVIESLKSGRVGALGIDVYEEEADLFFEDLSDTLIQDDTFARLLTFPNVLITGHQAFFTAEALGNIAETTVANLDACESGRVCKNAVCCDRLRSAAPA